MKQTIYLACLIAVFLLCPFNAQSQPNITDSIHVLQKICKQPLPYISTILHVNNDKFFGLSTKKNLNNLNQNGQFCLVRLDLNYDTVYYGQFYGGLQLSATEDYLNNIAALPNGNLVLAGYCESNDGTLQGVSHSYGREAWVMVVDTFGNIIHQKCFGGGGGTQLYALYIDEFGYIYIGGNTNATDNDMAHSFGSPNDAWMIKLDSTLTKVWTKIWGGNSDDIVSNINKGIHKDEVMISIITESDDALLGSTGVIGMADGYVVLIDTAGNEKWSRRYGGTKHDGVRKILADSLNNCYYFVGATSSIDGDIQYKTDSTYYLGEYKSNDWIARIDTLGNLLCSKAYGCKILDTNQFWGTHEPVYVDATWHNGALWYTSHVEGGNGDFPPNTEFNREDFWIAKIDSQCNLRGKYMVNTEYKYDRSSGFMKRENDLWIYGYSGNSFWADTSHNNPFSCDTTRSIQFYMLLGDAPLTNGSQEKPHSINWQVYPNPAQEKCMIQLENETNQSFTLLVTNSQGQVVWSKKVKNKSNYPLNTQGFTKGLYYITLKTSTTQSTRQILIQ